jgi:hypothetical protein
MLTGPYCIRCQHRQDWSAGRGKHTAVLHDEGWPEPYIGKHTAVLHDEGWPEPYIGKHTAVLHDEGWPEPYIGKHTAVLQRGLARTIYIRCIHSIFGREVTEYAVVYGAYIRSWPTLFMTKI